MPPTPHTLRSATFPSSVGCVEPAVTRGRVGGCPAVAPRVAAATDDLRAVRHDATLSARHRAIRETAALNNISDGLGALFYQYGIDRTALGWEDIVKDVRNPDGSPLTRAQLVGLGYRRVPKYLKENLVANELDGAIPAAVLDIVPIYFDNWLPPHMTLLLSFLATLLVILLVIVGAKTLARPVVHVFVDADGAPAAPAGSKVP
jgi:hypothetical protein